MTIFNLRSSCPEEVYFYFSKIRKAGKIVKWIESKITSKYFGCNRMGHKRTNCPRCPGTGSYTIFIYAEVIDRPKKNGRGK